jgi:RNA polymerase sigma-70 factor (ECF subfamily)
MMRTLNTRLSPQTVPPLEAVEEQRLIAAAQQDRRAFAPLYAHYASPIYHYCYARLGSQEAAEDATSLVFTNALHALPRYRDKAFRSWLFTIAHNVITDVFRVAHVDVPLEAAGDLFAPGSGPDELALSADGNRELRALVAQLPSDQRHVIELRLLGLSGPEIAQVLGRSHAWVKVVQFRAIARLRTLMTVETPEREVTHVAG